jgi:hypothetical protein
MMNWKTYGRKRSWRNFELLCRHLPGGSEEIHENLSQDMPSPGGDLNPGHLGRTSGRKKIQEIFSFEEVSVINF